MLRDSTVEGAGRRRLLIRITTDAVVARARRVHVVAAQLLGGIWSMRTEDVVDTLFLSLVGC